MATLNEKLQTRVDNTTVLRDVTRGFKVWSIDDIFFGKDEKGKHVPNVGDLVVETEGGTIRFKKVIAVNENTWIATLSPLYQDRDVREEETQFHAVGPGYHSETFRLFYDNSVVPHTLMMDSMAHLYGEDVSYIKIFKGYDISQSGRVISQYRSNENERYSENVPVYKLGTRFDDNNAIKRPVVCHTTEHLEDGDVVTIVAYTQSGIEASVRRFIVAHTANIRRLENSTLYVADVELVSPFISASDDRLLEFPSNMQRDGLFTMARVIMSDGSHRLVTIDGNKVSLLGLDHVISTLPHETASIALVYHLGPNELAWNASSGKNRHVTTVYRYRTLDVDGSYTVKITVVPEWISVNSGYRLRYFLFNLERTYMMEITDLVEYGIDSEPFNGRRYGVVQHLAVAINLDKLGIGLKSFRHVQTFSIALRGNPEEFYEPYVINYFGEDTQNLKPILLHVNHDSRLVNAAHNTVIRIHSDNVPVKTEQQTIEQYLMDTVLTHSYKYARPVYDRNTEANAITPTHVRIRLPDGQTYMGTIRDLANGINRYTSEEDRRNLTVGTTLLIEWLAVTNLATGTPQENELILDVTPAIIKSREEA